MKKITADELHDIFLSLEEEKKCTVAFTWGIGGADYYEDSCLSEMEFLADKINSFLNEEENG